MQYNTGKSLHTTNSRKVHTMLHTPQQHGGVTGDAVEICLKLLNVEQLYNNVVGTDSEIWEGLVLVD